MPSVRGQILLTLARRVLSHAEIDRVIEPAIADLQHEWHAATSLPLLAQLFVRARAYLSAVRVVGPRLLVSSVGATLALPSWSIVWPLIGPFLTFMAAMTFVSAFGPASTRTREHWLFYLPDRIVWFLPMMPATLSGWYQTRRAMRTLLQLRASDVARLSVLISLFCLAWSGWLGPLVRQQYLLALNLKDFLGASVHQWPLTQLAASLHGAPDAPAAVVAAELHMRLLPAALALAFGVLGWAQAKAALLWTRGIATALSITGFAILIGLLRVGGLVTPELSTQRIVAEWLSIVAVFLFALLAIRTADYLGRKRRPALEARALELLQALPKDRRAQLIGR